MNLSIDFSALLELSKSLKGSKFSCKLCSLGLRISMARINIILITIDNRLRMFI